MSQVINTRSECLGFRIRQGHHGTAREVWAPKFALSPLPPSQSQLEHAARALALAVSHSPRSRVVRHTHLQCVFGFSLHRGRLSAPCPPQTQLQPALRLKSRRRIGGKTIKILVYAPRSE